MKVFTKFNDLRKAPAHIQKYFKDLVDNSDDDPEKPTGDTLFVEYYGGDVFLIDKPEDLSQIHTTKQSETRENEWANIAEVADAFDECKAIPNFVVVSNATTDSGGPIYFIPKSIASRFPTVEESMRLTEEAWGSSELPNEN
jgi:hypothetical protein